MEWTKSYIWLWPSKGGQRTDNTKASKLFNILLVNKHKSGIENHQRQRDGGGGHSNSNLYIGAIPSEGAINSRMCIQFEQL